MNEAQLQAIITALDQITSRIGQAADSLQAQVERMSPKAVITTEDKQQNEQLLQLKDQNSKFQSGLLNIQNVLSTFLGKQQQTADEDSVRRVVQEQQIQSVRIVGLTDSVAQMLSSSAAKGGAQNDGSGSILMKMLMPLLGLLGAAGAAMVGFESGPGPVGSLMAAVTKFVDAITGFKSKIVNFVTMIENVPRKIGQFFGNFDNLLLDFTANLEKSFPRIASMILDLGVSLGKRVTDVVELIPGGFRKVISFIGSTLGTLFKGGAKALKVIPYIGNLMNIYFAYERFSSGDIKGGFMELASGLADFVPGIGNALGIGLDMYLMYRDATTTPEDRNALGSGGWQGILQSIKAAFTSALSRIADMPVLGNIYKFGLGIKRILSGDIYGGFKESMQAVIGWIPFVGSTMMTAFNAVESFFGMAQQPVEAAAAPAAGGSIVSTIGSYIRQKFSSLGSFAKAAIAAVGGPLASMFSVFGVSGDADLSVMLNKDSSNALTQNLNQVGANINNSYQNALSTINQRGINQMNQLSGAVENFDNNINNLNTGSLNALQGQMSNINNISQQAANNVKMISDLSSQSKPLAVSAVTADITSEQNVTNNILSEYSNNSQSLLSRLLEIGVQQVNAINVVARIMDNKSFDVNVNPQISVSSPDNEFTGGASQTQAAADNSI